MPTPSPPKPLDTSTYELEAANTENHSSSTPEQREELPTSSSGTTMAYNDAPLKSEGRSGDTAGRQIALISASIITATTWTLILMNGPMSAGWFSFHPPLQVLATFLFTFGIITLQPTSQPRTKAAGLVRHQLAMFVVGFPAIIIGTWAIYYNKWLRGAPHFSTWHGFFGIITVAWLILQIFLGAGSVWYNGALFGGGMKAKALWKYHRFSGYILFPLLLFTIHLGGAWSNWGEKYTSWIVRFLTYTIAPLGILVGVYMRIRPSKMQFTAGKR